MLPRVRYWRRVYCEGEHTFRNLWGWLDGLPKEHLKPHEDYKILGYSYTKTLPVRGLISMILSFIAVFLDPSHYLPFFIFFNSILHLMTYKLLANLHFENAFYPGTQRCVYLSLRLAHRILLGLFVICCIVETIPIFFADFRMHMLPKDSRLPVLIAMGFAVLLNCCDWHKFSKLFWQKEEHDREHEFEKDLSSKIKFNWYLRAKQREEHLARMAADNKENDDEDDDGKADVEEKEEDVEPNSEPAAENLFELKSVVKNAAVGIDNEHEFANTTEQVFEN